MNEEGDLQAGPLTFTRNSRAVKMFDILLRLPPLYMMDTLLGHNLGVVTEPALQQVREDQLNLTKEISQSTDLYTTFSSLHGGSPLLLLLPHIVRLLLSSLLYILSLFVFLLPTNSLLVFYRYLVCALVMPASYASHRLMQDLAVEGEFPQYPLVLSAISLGQDYRMNTAIIANSLVQCSLAFVMRRLLKLHRGVPQLMSDYLSLVMMSPAILSSWPLSSSLISWSAAITNLVPAVLLGVSLGQQAGSVYSHLSTLYNSKRQDISNYGLNTVLEAEWQRLQVPSVLRIFWLSRLSFILMRRQPPLSLDTLKTALVTGSDTLVSVLGMTSVVSTISHWLGLVFHLILSAESEEEKSVASVSAVLFFVLALQTGLTGMESEKRFQQICKNLCLLLTAILHFVHTMVQPVLMSISASRNTNKTQHFRALAICLFLLVAPSVLIVTLWKYFQVGTWILAVSAFCVEVIVKVLVTVTIYTLFMWDSHCEDGLWESLDDWVYYIRGVGNTVEFFFAIFLFFNGGWILIFESGGTIRACMMLIHAYFNIWCEARNGWSAFIKRRTAVGKINSLADASQQEIQRHNDVCAICYQEMSVAKVTRCKHMFHSICLRKWLYMQDNCPMCHEKLYLSTKQTEANGEQEEELVDTEDDNESDVTVDFTDSDEEEPEAEG